jgi:hypothetical protein
VKEIAAEIFQLWQQQCQRRMTWLPSMRRNMM